MDRRRDQIVSTLCDEAGQVRANLSQFIAVYDSFYVNPFMRAYHDGERPLPRLDEGPAAFYLPEDEDLKPAYRWYPASLQGFGFHLRNLQAAADSLSADLDCPAVQSI